MLLVVSWSGYLPQSGEMESWLLTNLGELVSATKYLESSTVQRPHGDRGILGWRPLTGANLEGFPATCVAPLQTVVQAETCWLSAVLETSSVTSGVRGLRAKGCLNKGEQTSIQMFLCVHMMFGQLCSMQSRAVLELVVPGPYQCATMWRSDCNLCSVHGRSLCDSVRLQHTPWSFTTTQQ